MPLSQLFQHEAAAPKSTKDPTLWTVLSHVLLLLFCPHVNNATALWTSVLTRGRMSAKVGAIAKGNGVNVSFGILQKMSLPETYGTIRFGHRFSS